MSRLAVVAPFGAARGVALGAAVGAAVGAALGICAGGLAAQVPAELRGRVADAQAARPVADARVEVLGRPEAARSGADGAFVLRGLEPRAYTLRVRAVGYRPRDVDVTVVNGRATDVALVLEPAAPARTPAARTPAARLAPVVVRGERDAFGTPAAVFDRAAIEASGRRDLADLVQAAPGVVVTRTGGAGAAAHASIRGSGAAEVLVLVDGVPLNSAVTGEADLSRVALEAVEQVTVRTGAQSARYGARAMAGVIDVRTRRPDGEASLLTRAGAWGERNAALAFGTARALGAAGGGAVGAWRLGADLTADARTVRNDFRYDVPAVRGGGAAERTNADVRSRQALGGATLDGAAARVRLRAGWQTVERGVPGSVVQPSATGRQDERRGSVGADAGGRRGRLAWTASADATRERQHFADPAPPFGAAYADTVRATALTALASATAAGAGPHAATFGAEVRSLGVRSGALAAGAPGTQHLYGAWGALRGGWPLGARTELAADAGLRLDHATLVGGVTASPRAGVGLTRGPVTAAASLGAGYTPPSLADQFFHEGVLVRPNPALRPERVRRDAELRLGVRDARLGALALGGEASAYRADVDGMVLWLPDFRFVWSPDNYAVRRRGWGLAARAALPNALPGVLPNTGLDAQATLDHADVAYAGPVLRGQVAYRPRTSAGVTAGLARRGVRLEVASRYVGARRTVPGSALNALAPYWLADARLTATRARGPWQVDATLGVENALDRPAAMLVDYPFPRRGWTVALRTRRAGARATP